MIGRAPVGRKVVGRALVTAAAVNGPAYVVIAGSATVSWANDALSPAAVTSVGAAGGVFVAAATGSSGWRVSYITVDVMMSHGALSEC